MENNKKGYPFYQNSLVISLKNDRFRDLGITSRKAS